VIHRVPKAFFELGEKEDERSGGLAHCVRASR
jgi:hypothetical protein